MPIHEPGTMDKASTLRIAVHRVPLEEVGRAGATIAKSQGVDHEHSQ